MYKFYKQTFLTITLFLIGLSANAQFQFDWVEIMNGSLNTSTNGFTGGYSVTTDTNRNVYVTGGFKGTYDFDSDSSSIITKISNGSEDIFIQKFNAEGDLIWIKTIGGTGEDFGLDIKIDAHGNVYIIGYFAGTVDFNPGPNFNNLITNGGIDIFILKLNNNGDFVWVKQMGGIGNDVGKSLTIDNQGFIYSTGHFRDVVDFNPSSVVVNNLTANGASNFTDFFIQKIDTSGIFYWVKGIGGANHDGSRSITHDNQGNIYVTGTFAHTVDFNPGVGTAILTGLPLNPNVFVLKMTNAGNFVWARDFGHTGYDYGNDIEVDAMGNVYTVGTYSGTVDFDSSPATFYLSSQSSSDVFIHKLDVNGNFEWVRTFGGNSTSTVTGIGIDSKNNIYSIGEFISTINFSQWENQANTLTSQNGNVYIHRITSDGDFDWVKSYGSVVVRGMSLDEDGSIYSTGYIAKYVPNSIDMGLDTVSSPVSVIPYTGNIFVHKIKSIINDYGISSLNYNACSNLNVFQGFVTNYGNNNIDTLVVNWSINDTMQTPIIIENTLDYSDSLLVNLEYSYIVGQTYTVKAWTSFPSVQDTINYNDTMITTLVIPVSNPTFMINQSHSICQGDTLHVAGTIHTTSGFYSDTLTDFYGCYVVMNSTLTVDSVYSIVQNVSSCQNEGLWIGNNYYDYSGVFVDTLTTNKGCDSIVTTNLQILPLDTTYIFDTICSMDTYVFNGQILSYTGIYNDTLSNINSCDSIILLELFVRFPVLLLNTVIVDLDSVGFGSIDITPFNGGGSSIQFQYTWSTGDTTQDVSNLTTQGYYYLTITDQHSCEHEFTFYLGTVSTNVTINNKNIVISLYPNPAEHDANVTLQLEGEPLGKLSYDIVDIRGRIMETSVINYTQNLQKFQIRMPKMTGMYYLRLYQENELLETIPIILK
jgi:hypothetical protein